tara:strand:- start:1275 stop:2174 length:900 start_codon:yes stop_codon:yes gene_type:complete
MEYHQPVLLHETVNGLNIDPNGVYVDVTFGGGGHSKAILQKLENGKLFAFDQDVDALENCLDDERFVLINQNFRYLKKSLRLHGITQVDGVLADLGVSSHQFDAAERGFSIREDGDLDMRMNQSQILSAKEVVNDYEVNELAAVLRKYGELKNAYPMSLSIERFRENSPIKTTADLKEAVKNNMPPHKSNKILAQLFQAIRIEVNEEMAALEEMLLQSVEVLKPNGRLSVISYHSLEDRLVKNLIKKGKFEGELERDLYGNVDLPLNAINRKPILPAEEEIQENSRARSAKLRIAEKVA